ncbi:MAG: hypothetical protein L3K04_04830 [Thermoplasmata archaeon]|nr:hypothetical protein [Thermoplasmata archaeon]
MPDGKAAGSGKAPVGFRVDRSVAVGRHPLLEVFPGLDLLATARRQEPAASGRRRLYQTTTVEVVEEDLWMYVAPWTMPAGAPRRWRPVVSPEVDCIVLGASHLRESEELILYLDIFHELCHIQQRRAGRRLFDRRTSYVRRSTEIEAYRFVIDEARDLGVPDATLREYLRVEWITDKEHAELCTSVGLPAELPAPRRRARAS